MLEETISKIRAAEARAREMIQKAEQEKILNISRAHREAEERISEEEKKVREEARTIIEAALLIAEKEKTEIEQKSLADLKSLLERTKDRIPEAQKLCR